MILAWADQGLIAFVFVGTTLEGTSRLGDLADCGLKYRRGPSMSAVVCGEGVSATGTLNTTPCLGEAERALSGYSTHGSILHLIKYFEQLYEKYVAS